MHIFLSRRKLFRHRSHYHALDPSRAVFRLRAALAGSIGQVREAATQILFAAKSQNVPVFVVGHVWRYRTDQFGWTTRSSQIYESRLLRMGSPLFHFAILLPDRPSLGRFVRHLGDIGARAGAGDHLVSESLYLQDPDNLGIEVYADRPRVTWRRIGRELMMATDPLDIPGLIQAGGQLPWEGMPAGTTIGHVHLHVGDLQRAATFYSEALGLDRMVWFSIAAHVLHRMKLRMRTSRTLIPASAAPRRWRRWRCVAARGRRGRCW